MKFTFKIELPNGIYTETDNLQEFNNYLADIVYRGRCRLREVKITIVKWEKTLGNGKNNSVEFYNFIAGLPYRGL